MSQAFYLNRTLFCDDQKYTEADLLTASNYIVILAEPGAGKTALLKSLAKQLGVKEVTASVFRYVGADRVGIPVVIDAFDELAKIDSTGIHNLLAKALEVNPTHVIISSRSSEWDNSATNTFEQFIGHKPIVVRLCEFDDSEQREIYTHHTSRDSFVEFQSEITRFSLEPLLPNPQFLKLFADAYIESEGHFTDKRSIFTKAVTNLAREANASAKPNPSISSDNKINLSSEIFAKLLLSGAEGIGISEVSENRMYPLFGLLLNSSDLDVSSILATRLFKPGDNADQHRPVHKIVAEYCASDYLIKRIATPSDPLTLAKCLPVIAPNGTVRDELRGLLGWMAALGNKLIEEAAIELDPYAVLANGDPSQLSASSKRLLLLKLKQIEDADPYFRRGDFWRRFSIAGFFTQDVVEEIRAVISDGSDGDLRDLLIELLVGSEATNWLVPDLRQLILAPDESKHTRLLAKKCLFEFDSYYSRLDLDDLIAEASSCSLNMAADIIEELGPDEFNPDELEAFFRSCVNLYVSHKDRSEVAMGGHYFVKHLISCLSLGLIERLLDSLSKDLACTCGKEVYECDCITGISKIIGSLLDRYFELVKPPFNSLRVWQWVKNLNFPNQINIQDSNSVKLLREDIALRQEIIAHVFEKLTDRDQIFQTKIKKFSGHHSHAGLWLSLNDYEFIVDLAFEADNTELWVSFMSQHRFHDSDTRGPDSLRCHMRKQASKKPAFMRRWAWLNRLLTIQAKQDDRKYNFKHRRSMKRRDHKKRQLNAKNIKFVQENREQVEGGRHWNCLVCFAELVLNKPEDIEQKFGDEKLVRNALINCLEFIEPVVPDLQKLAELQCASQHLGVEKILFAACLEILRVRGNLESVKNSLLIALRTNLNIRFDGVDKDQLDALRTEIDRLIFPNIESTEQFLRQYIEPQLAQPKCAYPEVYLLKIEEIFSPLLATLSIEWLSRFDELEYYALDELFEMATKNGDREELNKIIIGRCSLLLLDPPEPTNDEKLEQRRKFWFGRAFYFLSLEEAAPYWNWLKLDRNSVFFLNERSSRMSRNGHQYWPELTSRKIEAILYAFFDKWPKVHLPSSYGTDSPSGETAYRFLTGVVWYIGDDRSGEVIPIINRLLAEPSFADIHRVLKSIRVEQLRKNTLRYFEPPTPQKIVDLLDNNAVVTVEGLRQLIIQELTIYQKDIDGGEFNVANRFYTKDKNEKDIHLNEVNSVEIIADRLNLVLHPQNITVTSEHQTKNQNRIDITAAKMIDGKRRLLVIEAKGQWHSELYSAASTQLYERYSIHPDAEYQGIYLVIWFGADVNIAGRKTREITSAIELRKSIEETLPLELKGLIDVFVLDVSRT
jgi:cytidylate kinase